MKPPVKFEESDFDGCDAPLFKNRKLAAEKANAKIKPLLLAFDIALKALDYLDEYREEAKKQIAAILELKYDRHGFLDED